jgi:K+/H+ antiporter YhaU regulatory subunit KhtT
VIVTADRPACGRTLKALNVRGVTGATALALRRAQGGVVLPTGNERLEAGDALILAGSAEAVAAARSPFAAPVPVDARGP